MTTHTNQVKKAVLEMTGIFEIFDSIRIVKDAVHFRRSVTADGCTIISYHSKELLQQAMAMAKILNLNVSTSSNDEDSFLLVIRILE